ncbi:MULTISPECIES: lysylphosphatidylglycerol synthase transmembrane domain-containing protein [Streptomyces]|uniref:YbhN family protein n=2 Tax=Streptomyces TaxID=1883 RepID=A0ABV9J1B3_9ACTN
MSAETVGARAESVAPVVWGDGALSVRRPPRPPSVARSGPAVSKARIGVIVTEPHAAEPSALRRLLTSKALRTHFGTVAGVVILGVLLWRMGTGVLLDGLRRIDTPTLLAGLGIGLVTTVFSAWRWALVARGLRIRLPLGAAVADYYRSLFLNAALPGGILGDVHRAVRHGQSAGDVGRGVRAVVLERTAGQLALTVAGVTILLVLPSPVMADVRHFTPLVLLAAAGALAVVAALRMNSSASRRGGRLRATLAEAREGLLSRRNAPGVALSSVVVLTGHVAMFVVAARVAGSAASVLTLLPLAVLALIAMGLPLNVGGFGPREGVMAWAFGAAGLGASTGLSVAVVYGVLSFVAALPGAGVMVVRWYGAVRAGAPQVSGAAGAEEPYTEPVAFPEVSSVKYVPKESARLARSSFPFSADPREGRPMTPESV